MNEPKEKTLRQLQTELTRLEEQIGDIKTRAEFIKGLELFGLYKFTQYLMASPSPHNRTIENEAIVLFREIKSGGILCEVVSADRVNRNMTKGAFPGTPNSLGQFYMKRLNTKSERYEIEIPLYFVISHQEQYYQNRYMPPPSGQFEKIETKNLPLYVHHQYKGPRFNELLRKL